MADEEQIIYFFDIHSICKHPLKWLRKFNILMIFLVIFRIGAKKAQNENFVIHKYMEVFLLHWSCSIIYMPKHLILSSFSRQTKNVLAHFDYSYKWEQWFYEGVWQILSRSNCELSDDMLFNPSMQIYCDFHTNKTFEKWLF